MCPRPVIPHILAGLLAWRSVNQNSITRSRNTAFTADHLRYDVNELHLRLPTQDAFCFACVANRTCEVAWPPHGGIKIHIRFPVEADFGKRPTDEFLE